MTAERAGSQRLACSITPAATCTDGPSRPADSPASSAPDASTSLARLSRSDTNSPRCDGEVRVSSAASTCGIPEPAAPGTQRSVNHTSAAVSAGIQTSGSSGCRPRRRVKPSSASSLSIVKPTTASPAATAYASTTARSRQERQSTSSWRTAWVKSGCFFKSSGRCGGAWAAAHPADR